MAVARHERLRRSGLTALEIYALAALYFGSAKLGLLQQLVRGQVTPLWPPSGIAVAGLLLRGPRVWPRPGGTVISFRERQLRRCDRSAATARRRHPVPGC
jgi:integral membrane sensor domain MASE1